MSFIGLKTVVMSRLLLFCFIFTGVFVFPSSAREGIVPERDISLIDIDHGAPEWNLLWDKARSLVRAEKYLQAADVYSQFITHKPNIEQANWEYCKVLLKTGDFKTAVKIIETLLQKNSHRIEYFLTGGQAAAQGKDWETAARYYGRALEKDPTGDLSDVALEGLSGSLRSMGKKEFALPLAANLFARQPENLKVLQEMALDANNIGKNDIAQQLFKKLLERQDVDDKVLFQAVKIFDIPGNEKENSVLLEKYLKRFPDYLPFRHKLVDYYLNTHQYDAALEHLVYLIDHLENNDAFLKKAGTVNLYQLGRPDKALIYFERYFHKHPDSQEIKQNITNIQYILANDFLSIVENDGAWLLWRDLAKVTPNRIAIYLQMADLLEGKGMMKECLDILAIIHHHHPDDETISRRLAQKYSDSKQYENALNSLDQIVQKHNRTKAYYLLRAKIEIELERESDALSSYEAALQIDAGDFEVRKTSLELAGSLGDVTKLKAIFEGGMKNGKRPPDKEILFTYLDELARNHLFREYGLISNRFRSDYSRDKKTLDRMDLHLASVLRQEGKTRKAEQLLRQLLTDKRSVNEVLFKLTDNALVDKNLTTAKAWYGVLVKSTVSEKTDSPYSSDGYRRLLLKVRIAKAEREYEAADSLIEDFLNTAPNYQSGKEIIPLRAELEKERCWLRYYLGDYKGVLQHLEKHRDTGIFDPEIITLRSLLEKKLKQHSNEDIYNNNLLVRSGPRTSHLLAIIGTDLGHQDYDDAEHRIQTVLQRCPESVVGRVLLAKLLFARGRYSEAVAPLIQLSKLFPEESYFTKRLVEVEIRRGNYGKGLALLEQNNGGMENVDTAISGLAPSDDIEELLTQARLLWGDKQHEKALQIYRKLLFPSTLELLIEEFRQKQINYLYLAREKTIWNSILVLLQSEPDTIAELMEPAFLGENFTNEAGKIVADHYELYSWQKMISTEYLARKANFEKNYTFAEQSYKRLVDEQGTQEGMIDLAAIYGRVGKYRKEAQVYEAIQNSGTTSPELEKSIERSSLQLSPQNIFNATFSTKDGRGGFIDMETRRVGTSFWFTPDLDTDIRLEYSNNHYQSVHTSASTGGNSLYSSAIYEFAKDYELILGGGIDQMDNTSNAQLLYKIELKGQLDEFFHTSIEWGKSLVDDTVMALNDWITLQEIETGIYCETPLGLTFGGDFRHRNYSDNNSQNKIHGYTSYGIFGESVHLSLRYDYQFFKNTESNRQDLQVPDTQVHNVLNYWSPASFSENFLTLHFQHDFLGYQQGEKRKISYYSLDNSIGYDDLNILSYSGKFDIFLEMNPHFLLKGNVTFTKSDVFEEKGLYFSLHYRW